MREIRGFLFDVYNRPTKSHRGFSMVLPEIAALSCVPRNLRDLTNAACCIVMLAGVFGLCVESEALAQATDFKSAAAGSSRPVAKVEIAYSSKQSLGKGVTLARITNGMTVLVQENHSAPVDTVRCYVHNTGSA